MVSVQHSASQVGTSHKSYKKRKKSSSKGGKQQSQHHPSLQPHESLVTRTPWVDAALALDRIQKGKATGNKGALWFRSKIQKELYQLGKFIQKHPGKVLFVGFLILSALCVGLKSAKVENRVEKLWVEEGGRLQKELEFVQNTLGKGAGSISELVIQTPRDESGSSSVLSAEALLLHLDILKEASSVSVERDDVTWSFKDLCYALTIPMNENQVIADILTNLLPCAIITPLDCFWEGSKLLASDHPVPIPTGSDGGSMFLSWTSLNPLLLLRKMSSIFHFHNFEIFDEFMRGGGITTGYQEKPCLDPFDPDCPVTAPNQDSKTNPDIGAELTGGCYGFATRYMHWPEALIVGGTAKNKSGHITRAKGFQSVVQLMGEKDLYEFWSDTYRVHALDWSIEMASEILLEWQNKFSSRVLDLVEKSTKKYKMNAFSTSRLEEIIDKFSEFSPYKVAIGYVFMVIYTCITLFRCGDVLLSLAGLGLGGVILVTFTVVGGLGLSALLGIPYNAYTIQIIPFLALGLGVDSIFLLASNYRESLESNEDIHTEDRIGEVLSRAGMSVLLTAVCNIAAFVSAAVIPVPALRSFAFQAAILVACNLPCSLILFPAIMTWDLKRVSARRSDLFCCYSAKDPESNKLEDDKLNVRRFKYDKWTLKYFASRYYGQWISKTPVKILVLVTTTILTCGGLIGLARMEDGLDLTEIVPKNTSFHDFLQAQNKYFGFYNMFAVTKGHFEYPQNQKVLYDYHNSFVRVPAILKDDNGGLPDFWLSLFRNWLVRLQSAFDNDIARGNINDIEWFPNNASDDGILAFKLLVQTGHVDFPVDMSLLPRNRLVDIHGMINPSGFYNYLTAWVSNDATAYSFSQANFVPTPKKWMHDPRDSDLRVPKSQPIAYAQIPFYLSHVGGPDTNVMVSTVSQIREICSKFEEQRGLPNFPSGVPFSYWEQYISLRFWLAVSLGAVMAGTFGTVSVVFASPWLGTVVVVVLTTILVQLIGAMGLVLGIHFSAVPAVVLILAVGIGVEFTLHICIGFVTSVGSKNRRIVLSLKHMFTPVFHGAVSTFLGIIMLAFSHFDFVFRYFFLVLSSLILLGLFNGLVFLPVLLLMFGPPGEIVPHDEADFLNSSPETSRHSYNNLNSNGLHVRLNNSLGSSGSSVKKSSISKKANHHQSDLSLSTIAEESYNSQSEESKDNTHHHINFQQQSGTSVYVEPQVVVETTTYPASNGSHSSGSSRSSTPTSQITKVTATAKFKVEVHAPAEVITSSSLGSNSSSSSKQSRRKRRGSLDASSSTTTAKNTEKTSTTNNTAPLEKSHSVHSSLSDSLRSSINSNGSSHDGDLGFSER
uniref:Protein patchedlike [Bombus terrestris] n=2 Tax=Lepeophtheirus salmonis TaxID=72036 RepID=A0A0K2T4G9_LEPSM